MLLVISALLALGALEIGLRLAGVSVGTLHISRMTIEPDNNPQLLYRLKPGGVARAEVEYRINEHGMRNRPVTVHKPPDTRRLLVMGDSIAFGYWVPAGHTVSSHLEAMLNEHRRGRTTYEVLNLGVPGYNLDQEIERLRIDGLRFDPDLVIFAFCLNDLESLFSYDYGLVENRLKDRESAGPLGRLWNFGLDHSLLCAWIEYRRTEFTIRRRFAGKGPRKGSGAAPEERRQAGRRDLTERYRRIAALLRERDLPGLVVIFPTIECSLEYYEHAWVHEAVATAAGDAGLDVVDLQDAFRSYPGRETFVDPFHPSPMGYRIAAHAVFEHLAASEALGSEDLDTAGAGSCDEYQAEDFPQMRGY